MTGMKDRITLANGVQIPYIGYGTFTMAHRNVSVAAMRTAIEAGYRYLDNANYYPNEVFLREVIRTCGLPREELFISSKLWNNEQGYEETLRAVENTLKKLQTDYLDMYMIHWPIPAGRRADHVQLNLASWRAMEKCYKEGLIRVIGVSNFLPHHLQPLMDEAEIQPMIGQLEFNPDYQQPQAIQFLKDHGIQPIGWAPLGKGKALTSDTLAAISEKHGKTPAQVTVRFAMQSGVIPIPKSDQPERIYANIDVFDFALDETEMAAIRALHTDENCSQHPDDESYPPRDGAYKQYRWASEFGMDDDVDNFWELMFKERAEKEKAEKEKQV